MVTKVTSVSNCGGAVLAKINGETVAVKTISCGRGRSGSSSYINNYPNPVYDILTVEIDSDAAQALLPVKASLTFDVRLYDGQGNMLRQATTKGGMVQFSVSGLPYGIYYLHIYDGVNSTPEIRQIIVER